MRRVYQLTAAAILVVVVVALAGCATSTHHSAGVNWDPFSGHFLEWSETDGNYDPNVKGFRR